MTWLVIQYLRLEALICLCCLWSEWMLRRAPVDVIDGAAVARVVARGH